MIRVLSAIALSAVLLVVSAATASGESPKNSIGCEATSARLTSSGWKLGCGDGGTCTSGGCTSAVSRDVNGDFYTCRCPQGGASPCCQLVLRTNGDFPESMGDCASCGKSGACKLEVSEILAGVSCNGVVERN